MKHTDVKAKHLNLKKSVTLLTAAAVLFVGGVCAIETAKADPGFKLMGTTLSPFVTLGYARVVYTNMPSFKKMVENAFSPNAVTWQQDNIEKTSDVVTGSIGLQIGKYIAISTGGSSNTTTHFSGTLNSLNVGYVSKYTYNTRFYQLVKMLAGYPLFSNNYYPFISLSANYEKLNAKYQEKGVTNSYSASGKDSARAVLPGVGLGLLVNLPKTNNHLSMQLEYEFIRGKNASGHAMLGSNKYQLFNRFPQRNQFLMGLRYTI